MALRKVTKSKRLYLAIDQGGHASRAVVFDARGNPVASGCETVGVRRLPGERVEYDAEEIVASIRSALGTALRNIPGRVGCIAGAGLATQRSNTVCWNRRTGAPLSAVISWQDRRAAAWMKRFAPITERIRRLTGLRSSPHYGASKLRWCLDHLESVRKAADRDSLAWGPMASFLLFRLVAGRPFLVDPVNASRTLLWNIESMDWEPELLELFGLPGRFLPKCVSTRHRFGHLEVSGRRIPLTVMTGDQSAALFSMGRPSPHTVYINIGTGAFVQRLLPRPMLEPSGLLCSVVYREKSHAIFALEGTVNGAGSAVDWVMKMLKMTRAQFESHAHKYLEEADSPLMFLNGISGLGSPYWVPDFVSRFEGKGGNKEKVAAVLESIVFLIRTILDEMREWTPAVRDIRVSGGLARLDGLCRRLADLACVQVHRHTDTEATARGTAYLVAGCPSQWLTDRRGDCFYPTRNSALHRRYKLWRGLMRKELDETSGVKRLKDR